MAEATAEDLFDGEQLADDEYSQLEPDAQFVSPELALRYILGGKGRVTIRSQKTGARYTYKCSQPKKLWRRGGEDFYPTFVKVLSRHDNTAESSYMFIGLIGWDERMYACRGSHPDAPSYKALDWVLAQLGKGEFNGADIWHEGVCCRCGRTLTVPESIMAGLGPICASRWNYQL